MKTKLPLIILLFALATANIFAQISNSGFENWTTVGSYEIPNGWITANSYSSGPFYPVTKAADPFPVGVGTFSIKIENSPSLLPSLAALGAAFSSPTLLNPNVPSFPITGHPTSLTGYYKWLPQNGDTMFINISLFQGGSNVASGQMLATITASSWTSFNIPITVYVNADSATIMLASYYSNGPPPQFVPRGNSVLNIDNLNFDNLITGISEVTQTSSISVYPNPFTSSTTLQIDNILKNATLTVYNSFGQTVKQLKNISGQTVTLFRDNLPSGLYFIRLTEDNKLITVSS